MITNSITAFLLVVIFVTGNYTQRLYQRFQNLFPTPVVQNPNLFIQNPSYGELTDLYSTYTGQKNIVMLGNSLTNRVNWNELLGRNDIANRGIGSDITAGFLHRMHYVVNVKPKICFIEGGINDINLKVPNETTLKNLNTLVDILQQHHIKPVLCTVTLVSAKSPIATSLNQKIKAFNLQIRDLATTRKVALIDLNPRLSDGTTLRTECAIGDGVHFTSKSYKVWKDEIQKILAQEQL